MSFNELITKIKNFFSKILSYLQENKKRTLIILISLLLLLLFILIISYCIKNLGKESNYKQQLYFSEELLIPEGPQTNEEYKVTRQTNETWSKEETDQWFTIPTTKEINILEKQNDKLVSDILGAAP